jgi:hypothetical protein
MKAQTVVASLLFALALGSLRWSQTSLSGSLNTVRDAVRKQVASPVRRESESATATASAQSVVPNATVLENHTSQLRTDRNIPILQNVTPQLRSNDSIASTAVSTFPPPTNLTSGTIVSAYYDMKSKHAGSRYRKWMMNFFSLSDSMVIFTSARTAPFIWEGRAKYNATNKTKVVILELNETDTAKMFNTSFWEKQLSMDPERRIHKWYHLYWVWLAKTEFVRRTVDMNPFHSEFFAWVDIGYFREERWNGMRMLQQIPPALREDQVLLLDVNFGSNRVVPFNYPRQTVGGGFIGGYAKGIFRWSKLFYNWIKERQSEFIGKDQLRMYQTCFQEPNLCLLVKPGPGNFGDNWFFMAPFLILGQNQSLASTWVPSRSLLPS